MTVYFAYFCFKVTVYYQLTINNYQLKTISVTEKQIQAIYTPIP